MKDFMFKAAVKLFGWVIVAYAGVLMYNHAISNLFVLSIVFTTFVYLGVKLANYDYSYNRVNHNLLVLTIAYFSAYYYYKRTGKNDGHFTFDEDNPLYIRIRNIVDDSYVPLQEKQFEEAYNKGIEIGDNYDIMKRDADDIALLCEKLEEKIVTRYHLNDVADKDYIEINLPKILFHEDQKMSDEFYNGLVEELWWVKFYDRTFFIVKPDLWVGIKNTLSSDEQWNILKLYVDNKAKKFLSLLHAKNWIQKK